MSITLANPITKTDFEGNTTIISQIQIKEVKIRRDRTIIVEMEDVVTGEDIGVVTVLGPLAQLQTMKGQIETLLINQGKIIGTQD